MNSNNSNNNNKYYNITLALGGVFQAASLVNEFAMTGVLDENHFLASISSVYKIDADDVPSVYGGANKVGRGLQELVNVLDKSYEARESKPDPNVSRYALSLILLQNKLFHHQEMLAEIRRRIKHAVSQAEYFSPTHSTVIANLADIYTHTISTFRYRIQITGKATFLHNQECVDKMRALFLAGIRSAVLWRQVGGKRWQLFFARRKLLTAAKRILQT